MAGEFENRADTASLRALRASLEALRSELGPQIASLRAQVTRIEQETARGSGAGRGVAGEGALRRGAEGRPVTDEEIAPRQVSRNIEDRTTRLDRLNNAEQRLVQTRERMRTTPGGVVLPGGAKGGTAAEQELAARQAGGAPTILGPGTRAGEARQAETRAAAGEAGAVRNVEGAMLAETQTRGLAIQQLQRHGALTSEFFSGLARGEVTLREVGTQMAITTAKFGGWLLAGGAIFFVVDALRQLSRGAIDANAAVNKLQQVLPNIDVGKAHEQVRGLASRYNVEFAQVGDALQEAAKHVRDQAGAFRLAGTSLEAEKIFPDLKPDIAIKGLTAITRGFKLPLDQSKQVLDELTVLSSHFGVSAADSLTGAAKAAATFRNAGGGSTKELLAMVGAMNRLGYSSNEAGTAIRRSAEIIQRPGTKNRGLLEAFGIDIRAPYSQIIRQAVEQVSSGKVRGREVNRLATALATPQLSSRFAAILNRPDIYNRMLRDLGAPTTKGAADRRLDTALQSAQQQIKRIGVDLQKLGDELAQGGLFNVLHQLLSTLHGILSVAGAVTSAFADLPKPIQQSLVYAAELYAVMRLLRRFGVTNRLTSFGGGIAGAATGTSQARSLAQDRTVAARGALDAATARVTTTENEMALAAQAYATALEQGTASQETLDKLKVASTNAENEYNVATYRLAAARASLAAREEEQAAVRTGATGAGPVAGAGRGGATTFIAGAATAEGAQAAQAERLAAEETAMTARLRATSANFPKGIAGRSLDTAMWGAYRGVSAVGTGATNLAGRMVTAGERFAAMIGPLDLAIVALLAIPAILDAAKSAQKKETSYLEKAGRSPRTPTERERQIAEGRRAAEAIARGDAGTYKVPFYDRLGTYGTPPPPAYTARSAGQAAQRDQEVISRYLRARESGGTPLGREAIPGTLEYSTADARRNAAEIVGRYRAGSINRAKALRLLGLSLKDIAGIDKSVDSEAKKNLATNDITRLQDAVRAGKPKDVLARYLAGLNVKDFTQRFQDDATVMQTYLDQYKGLDKNRLPDLRTGLRITTDEFRRHPTVDNAKKLKAVRDAIDNTIQEVQKNLTDTIAATDSPTAHRQAFDHAIAQLRQLPKGDQRAKAIRALVDQGLQDIASQLDDQIALARTTAGKLSLIARATARLRRLPQTLAVRKAEQGDADKDYQTYTQGLDASYALAEQRASSSAEANALELRKLNLEISRARKDNQDSTVLLGLYLARRQLISQGVQDQLQIGQLQGQLAVAQVPSFDAVGRARVAASYAQRNLGAVVRNRAKLGKDFQKLYLEAQVAVADTQTALADSIRQQSIDLANSQIDLRESRTDDPIKLARLELRRANEHIAQARTAAERNAAKAERNKDARALVEARISEREDDVQFQLDMHKISNQQAEADLQALLKLHGVTKQMRREILRRIQSLKDAATAEASGFALDVGSIKLPTVYDVRRAIRAGRGGAGGGTTVHQQNSVLVNVHDKNAAGAVYDAIDSAMGTSVGAAARNAGLV